MSEVMRSRDALVLEAREVVKSFRQGPLAVQVLQGV
jgi:hypothetical protein